LATSLQHLKLTYLLIYVLYHLSTFPRPRRLPSPQRWPHPHPTMPAMCVVYAWRQRLRSLFDMKLSPCSKRTTLCHACLRPVSRSRRYILIVRRRGLSKTIDFQ